MVNEEGFIIDGQHRFYVCKKLGLNVYYVVVPNFTLRQVAEMNSNSSKWKDRDYLNCYVDVNLEPYKRLDEFLKEYAGVSIGVAVTLLHTGHVQAGSGSRDDFRDGLFKANYIHEAHQLMKKVLDFQNYCESYTSRSFIKAVEELIQSPEYDHQAFLEKLQIHSLVIDQKSTHKEYLQHMEDLFNFRNSKRRRIY